jgi:hypothetical protein
MTAAITHGLSRRALLIAALATGACSVRHAPATWIVTTTDESRETFVQALREFAEAEGYDFSDEVGAYVAAQAILQETQESQSTGAGRMRVISLQNSGSIILAMSMEPNKFDVSVMSTPLPWALGKDALETLASRLERTVLSSPGIQVERRAIPEQSR